MRRFVVALLVLLVTSAVSRADPPTINLSRIEGAFLEPRRLTPQGERLFFEADVRPLSGGEFLRSIWVTRGTLASTIRIPLQGVHPLIEQRLLGVFGQRLFVYAWSPDADVPGVYVHDLLSSRTELLIRGYVSEAATNREAVFFMIYGGPGEGLYRSDGTRARTRRVRTDTAIGLLGLRGYLLYQAAVPGLPPSAIGLFSSGPTAETLLMVLPTLGETPVIVGDRAFFVRSAFGQVELWSTDGTVDGTHRGPAGIARDHGCL